jgi:rubrerythrin
MNYIDRQKEARVWQRVQESKPAPKPDRLENLQELIMNEWIAAATYAQLSRQLPQKEAAVLQRLSREEHGHGACLRGMYSLVTGEKCPVHNHRMEKEPVERTLRRCYGLEMRSLKEYEAKCDDPEYGHIFARLADQEREHCMALLGVLGNLERNKS